jgi:hypothetical protein
MPTPIVLKVFRGNELVRSERFEREIIKIGRLASAHLVLDDDKVSRIHSVIEVSPEGGLSIIDMGSAEGTFVNGRKVSRGKLELGDKIRVGGLEIMVAEGEAAPTVNVAVAPVNEAVDVPLDTPAPAAPAPARTNGAAHAPAARATAAAAPAAAAPAAAAPAPQAAPALVAPAARPAPVPLARAEGAPEDLSREEDVGVELRLLWGDTLVDAVAAVRPRAPVLVGDGPGALLRFSGVDLPAADFPALRFHDGQYQFAFARGMTGVAEDAGKRETLAALVKARRAEPDGKLDGTFWIPVPKMGGVRAELGARLALEARARRPEKVKEKPFWERINYAFLNLFLVLFFLQSAFIVAASNFPYDTDVVADDLFTNPSRMAKFVIKPPEQKPQPKLEQLAKGDDQAPGETAEKHKGEEGKMGKKDAPKTDGRSAPKAIDPNAKELVKRTGLLAALGRGGSSGLSTVFGSGGLGGDIRGAVGNMYGPTVGDSFGFGGLGIRGTGAGGGGAGNTIGIGAVGTKGRGGGLGGYGTGVGGLGKKGDRDVNVSTGNAVVMGSIDRELVRKVIQDHAAQIRYCYEQQLSVNPKLAGKVSIKWVINADGSASQAQVEAGSTTLEDPKVHECMMARIQSWQFPRPKGGGIAVITYPWILRSAGGG